MKLPVLSFEFRVSSFTFHVSRFTVYCLLFTVYCSLLLVACGGSNADEPPEIVYGQDVCNQCSMIISEARFAASYVTTTGDVRHFESIEDMLMYYLEHQEAVHIFWVHDYETETWVRGDEAVFVLSETVVTPMGGGVVAVADEAGADELIAEGGGTAVSFDQLLSLAEAGGLQGYVRNMSHE